MKYRDKKTGEIIEAHPSLDLTGHYIIDYNGAFCMIPQEIFFKIYKPIENEKNISVAVHLNMDKYIKLLDEAKKKAQELQNVIDKLKNAKVEAVNNYGKNVNVVVNCNTDFEATSEKVGEYIVNKVKEATKNM